MIDFACGKFRLTKRPFTRALRATWTIVLLCAGATLLACSKRPSGDARPLTDPLQRLPAPAPSGSTVREVTIFERSPIVLATYNTGLARDFIADCPARATKIGDALAHDTIDVICLQEIWSDDDWQRIAEKTRRALPHGFRAAPRAIPPECSSTDVPLLQTCAATCAEQTLPARCAVERCGVAASLSSGCRRCVAASLVAGKPLRACTQDASIAVSSGLALLSRWPLADPLETPIQAPWLPRSILSARVLGPAWNVRVLCTHLPVPLTSGVDLDPAWTASQRRAIRTLIRWTARGGFTAVLGDLNVGPATAGTRAFFPELYEELSSAGLDNPYAARPDARCTHCDDNPFVGTAASGTATSGGVLIDHVLLRNAPGHASAERMFVEPVPPEAQDGGCRSLPLSDHYGIRATIERK